MLPMYYIGDADPYGAEIFFTYLFGSTTSCVIENKDRCETMFNLHWIGPFTSDIEVAKSDLMPLTQRDKQKVYSLLVKPYLA